MLTQGIKKLFPFLILVLCAFQLFGQNESNHSTVYMLRAYEDDDYFNDIGMGTDKAYTSGEQLNLFYNLNHKPGFFLDKILPKAGDSSINTYSLGLMQMMYTPDYLTTSYYVYNDYSYAGADFAKHSLYSYNPKKKYDLQTELVLGIMGPSSFAGTAQHWLHTVLQDTAIPNGWGNQYRNAVLANINFTIEKEIVSNKGFQAIGRAQISAGTMFDAIELGTSIYIGKMNPYFNGFMGHFSNSYTDKCYNKIQLYIMLKAAGQYVRYSAMIQGGMFSPQPMVKTIIVSGQSKETVYVEKPKQEIENFVGIAEYGPVITYKHWAASWTQTYSTPVLKNVYSYIYGNMSIYYSW